MFWRLSSAIYWNRLFGLLLRILLGNFMHYVLTDNFSRLIHSCTSINVTSHREWYIFAAACLVLHLHNWRLSAISKEVCVILSVLVSYFDFNPSPQRAFSLSFLLIFQGNCSNEHPFLGCMCLSILVYRQVNSHCFAIEKSKVKF